MLTVGLGPMKVLDGTTLVEVVEGARTFNNVKVDSDFIIATRATGTTISGYQRPMSAKTVNVSADSSFLFLQAVENANHQSRLDIRDVPDIRFGPVTDLNTLAVVETPTIGSGWYILVLTPGTTEFMFLKRTDSTHVQVSYGQNTSGTQVLTSDYIHYGVARPAQSDETSTTMAAAASAVAETTVPAVLNDPEFDGTVRTMVRDETRSLFVAS